MKAEKNNWVAKYTSDEYDCRRDDLRIIDASDIDHPQGPFTVATVNGTGPHAHHGIDAARLMAAAPEMLEALLAAESELRTPTGVTNRLTLQVSQAIKAATTRHIPDQRTDVRDEETEAAGMAQLVTDMTAAVAAAAALKEARIQSLEDEGLTRSDAQGVVMAERKMF